MPLTPETTGAARETLDSAAVQDGIDGVNKFIETQNPEDLRDTGRKLQEAYERGSRRTVDDVIRIKNGILTKERLNALPLLKGNMDIRSGAPGGNEQLRLRKIRAKLGVTARMTKQKATAKRKAGQATPYLPTFDGERNLVAGDTRWRHELQKDIDWLSDPTRIGPNVPPERQNVFEAYRRILSELTAVNAPKTEQKILSGFRGDRIRNCYESLCRNPNAPKNASKFALLLVAGTMLAFWGIMDIRNKSLSLGTMVLLGGVVFLMQNGSKYDFLGSRQFCEVACKKLGGDATKKLRNLSRTRAAAFNHLVKTLDDHTHYGKPITQETIRELTHPTKKSGGREVINTTKAVPEDIANLFLGLQPGSAAFSLKGIRSTANMKDSDIVPTFAESIHKRRTSRGALRSVTASS